MERATRVFIRLASTLRNIGESAEAVTLLEFFLASKDDEGALQTLSALALDDAGRYGDALRTVLLSRLGLDCKTFASIDGRACILCLTA